MAMVELQLPAEQLRPGDQVLDHIYADKVEAFALAHVHSIDTKGSIITVKIGSFGDRTLLYDKGEVIAVQRSARRVSALARRTP